MPKPITARLIFCDAPDQVSVVQFVNAQFLPRKNEEITIYCDRQQRYRNMIVKDSIRHITGDSCDYTYFLSEPTCESPEQLPGL